MCVQNYLKRECSFILRLSPHNEHADDNRQCARADNDKRPPLLLHERVEGENQTARETDYIEGCNKNIFVNIFWTKKKCASL